MRPLSDAQTFQKPIEIDGRLQDVDQFGDVIVKSDLETGSVTRLRDIAQIELGSKSYAQVFRLNGHPSAAIAISQLPEANALEVSRAVEKEMAALSRSLPEGVSYSVLFNTTAFVNAAVKEVYKVLIEACVIVLGVILLFLQDWRAMLVPATTVPVTLIGVFAAMVAFGFTINMSTLFALVLAIGIVVDDAIIIVEGTARHLGDVHSGAMAAEKAMTELFGPIVGITLVLLSVLLPASFLSGLTGELYRQFALVIAGTSLISAVNAVSLKPVQAALWMSPPTPVAERNVIFRLFDRGFSRLESGYARWLGKILRHRRAVGLATLALICLAFVELARVPSGFLPIEDQGYMLAAVQLPAGASLQRMDKTLEEVERRLKTVPGVANVLTVAGVSVLDNMASLSNAGLAYIVLEPWDERGKDEGLLATYKALNKALKNLDDGHAIAVPPPPIQGVGNISGATMMVELTNGSGDYTQLNAMVEKLVGRIQQDPRMQSATQNAEFDALQVSVEVERKKAKAAGVAVSDVFNALSGYLGAAYVNQFTKFGQTFQVYLQADGVYRTTVDGISHIRIPNSQGNPVPVSEFVTVREMVGPSLLTLYNLHPAVTITGRPRQDVSSGQVMDIMAKAADDLLPRDMGFEWSAMSYQEQLTVNQIYLAFALAVILVYFVLAGQYESWLGPLPVILSVPLALAGTVAVFLALELQNTLLIALAAKNAILIVEFARDMRIKEGRNLMDAAIEAGRLRLRPILMTSIAFILGMVPLILASGAGANASKSIGISVVSGMLISTVLSIFVVPCLFLIFRSFEERILGRG